MAEGEFDESPQLIAGEDQPFFQSPATHVPVSFDLPIVEKKMTFEEASKCLTTLGKDESCIRYAYLMITAQNRKLTDISVIINFRHVLFLDLTGNFLNLDALQVLTGLPFLIMLKVSRNRVESAALDTMHYLQELILNLNKIEETCDIAQPMLDTLDLGFNQIFTAQFDDEKLPNLKELSLKGNQLIDLSGSYPKSLEKLFIAENNITKISSLVFSQMSHLTTLYLRDNQIKKLNGFSEFLTELRYLNLRNNSITKLRQFRKLSCLPQLETLIYTGNPVDEKNRLLEISGEKEDEENVEDEEAFGEGGGVKKATLDPIRIGVLVLLPNLKRINKAFVTFEERDQAFLVKDTKFEEIMGELSSDEETEPPTTTYTSEIGESTETESNFTDQEVIHGSRTYEEYN